MDLHIVSGQPTDTEICALICALTALRTAQAARPEPCPRAGRPLGEWYGYRSPRSWTT
ncbi:acyl-CoA carboxylase subunit epsilon [Nonomuraea sp. K274]|uniref:Acyl-CoA carboxylase subunit epsilon n=1 Tax=Nonomuraea cypriaca TaxID=1187855 RepID=A0A931ADF0_9ACTN|nr:acyl-CoA carboxylase subunit epsilon [Nonomuraea cypriaca]MBF8190917.1 acyl-CoA carboxylase subunit epsilon [Nonomuraea cypriaca]